MQTSQLNERERVFIDALVKNGGNQKAAATAAGYAHPAVAGHNVARRPRVMAELRAARERTLNNRLAALALGTMEELMSDKKVSPAVRFQAARWTLEAAGHSPRALRDIGFDPDKPLTEMNLSELQAFIAAGSQALEHLKQPRPINGADSDADNGGFSPSVEERSGQDSGHADAAELL